MNNMPERYLYYKTYIENKPFKQFFKPLMKLEL